MARPMTVDTVGNAVPPLDPELAGLLDDLADIHPGIDLILDGVRLIALDRLDADDRRRPTDMTQLLAVTLAGSPDGTDVLTLIGLLVARITTADSPAAGQNPPPPPPPPRPPPARQQRTRRHPPRRRGPAGDPRPAGWVAGVLVE